MGCPKVIPKREQTNTSRVIINVLNEQRKDLYFRAPIDLAQRFKEKVLEGPYLNAWNWWMSQVDVNRSGKRIQYASTKDIDPETTCYEMWFVDSMNPIKHVKEWDF